MPTRAASERTRVRKLSRTTKHTKTTETIFMSVVLCERGELCGSLSRLKGQLHHCPAVVHFRWIVACARPDAGVGSLEASMNFKEASCALDLPRDGSSRHSSLRPWRSR